MSMFIRGKLQFSFLEVSLSGFNVKVMLASWNELESVSPAYIF